MVCPNCNITPLRIKNNNYYCPSCEVYIGSVEKSIESLPVKTATSRWQLQAQSQNETEEDLITEEVEDKGGRFSIAKFFVLTTITFLIIGVYYIIPNLSNYISFSPYCNIKIKEKKAEFKAGIIREFEGVKGRDPFKYINICSFVDTVIEGVCPVADQGRSSVSLTFEDRCYIRGSKMIYLKDVKYLEDTADLSKDYWEKQ